MGVSLKGELFLPSLNVFQGCPICSKDFFTHCVCVHHMHASDFRAQKRVLGPLELELLVVGWVLGTQPGFSEEQEALLTVKTFFRPLNLFCRGVRGVHMLEPA